MFDRFSRTRSLIGENGLEKLKNSTVAVFGIGGVGSYAAEALARAGIGNLVLVDHDTICATDINRQVHALFSTLGRPKAEAMADRIRDINPEARVIALRRFFSAEVSDELVSGEYDYIIDAIDTVPSKVELIVSASEKRIPIISCMGAGNKLCPEMFEVGDIRQATACPLARAVRRGLRGRGVESVRVVYSKEPPLRPENEQAGCTPPPEKPVGLKAPFALRKRFPPGSVSFVPPVAGLMAAGAVIRDLLGLSD